MTAGDLRTVLARFPMLGLVSQPSPVEPMPRLSETIGGGLRLVIKRDDTLAFAFGGNKVRKLAYVGARAREEGADTLITAGGVQSNHARVTAAVAAKLGMRAVLVANGRPSPTPTANALLVALLGAEVEYVATREARGPAMHEIAERTRKAGGHPYEIEIGASIPLGALGYIAAVLELLDQMRAPDVIVHATSSGGTQAGLVAGCRLLGLPTRVIGISADEPAAELRAHVGRIVSGVGDLLGTGGREKEIGDRVIGDRAIGTRRVGVEGTGQRAEGKGNGIGDIEVDDQFVGGGYGVPTDASQEAVSLAARSEAIFLDPTYTAKAMAGLIAYARQRRFAGGQTVLFWHTGGQVGLFT